MSIREAFQAAAPCLREFKAALDLGRLVICGQCQHFTFASDPQALGACAINGEAWPFVPFQCLQFERRQKPETQRNGSNPNSQRHQRSPRARQNIG